MKENRIIANNGSSIVLYMTDDGNTQLEVKLEKDTVWLTQSQMAELFGRDRTVVGRHIANVYKEGELSREVTRAFFAQVTPHGAMPGKTHSQQVPFYNLDMVISVGYRVNSKNATRFRQWATSILKLSVSEANSLKPIDFQMKWYMVSHYCCG